MNLRAKRLPLCHESEHRSRSFPWYYTKPRHILSALLWLSEGRMCLFIHALKEGLLRTEGHGSEMSVSNKQHSHYWFNLQTMWSKFPKFSPSSSLILDRTTQKSDRPSVSSQRQTFFHVPWFLLYLTGQAADGGAKPKAQSCFKCQGYYISATKWISRTNCLSSKVMVHNYLLRKEGLWVQKKGIGWLSYVPGKWTIDVYRCNLTG